MPERSDPPFLPLSPVGGYLRLEDHGLIGDGVTAALVGRDGSIPWMCIPRFDARPLFCGLLDRHHGGCFSVEVEGWRESRQQYEPDSAVLVTELRGARGVVRIVDALLLGRADLRDDARAARGELLRSIQVVQGEARVRISIQPYGGATAEPRGGGLRVRVERRPELDLQLWCSAGLQGLETALDLREGARVDVVLGWGKTHFHHRAEPEELLESTRRSWRSWTGAVQYDGPEREVVRRSAITLKLLDYFENGAMVAAPTSSLPEVIGGERNWDYRYAWIRDAAFSVYAFDRVGMAHEAEGFLGWVMDSVEAHARPCVLYTLDGEELEGEREDEELEGYRRSRPVRWGNAAAGQRQHDVYGEILDCAFQWMKREGRIEEGLWSRLRSLVERARREWREPDRGIWEVRTAGRPFTYSAALCQVAIDRGIRIAERYGLKADVEAWRRDSEAIREAILEEAWDERQRSLVQHLGGGGGLDASVLALPLRRVVDARHPRMIASVRAVAERLGAGDGLLYRYLPRQAPDGVLGDEGAFLICSFWHVDNLAMQGRLDEAHQLFARLCRRASPLGLLPEEIDPGSGEFRGNFPQAFSHVGVISSAANLLRPAPE